MGNIFLKKLVDHNYSQLLRACYIPIRERRSLCGAEKSILLLPLVRAFVTNKIVEKEILVN